METMAPGKVSMNMLTLLSDMLRAPRINICGLKFKARFISNILSFQILHDLVLLLRQQMNPINPLKFIDRIKLSSRSFNTGCHLFKILLFQLTILSRRIRDKTISNERY